MPWATFDDQFAEHPKNAGLSDAAFRLHTTGILYCNRHMTDGLIDVGDVPRLVRRFRASGLAELLEKGHWYHHEAIDAYEIHDYLEWNRSRAEILTARERKSKGGKKGAQSRWHNP